MAIMGRRTGARSGLKITPPMSSTIADPSAATNHPSLMPVAAAASMPLVSVKPKSTHRWNARRTMAPAADRHQGQQ